MHSGQTQLIDARGARFASALAVPVLAVAFVAMPGEIARVLLLLQAVLFLLGAGLGLANTPQSWLYTHVVRGRLPDARENSPTLPTYDDERSARCAQAVGLLLTAGAAAANQLASTFGGATAMVALVLTGVALASATLHAAFGVCLGDRVLDLVAGDRSAESR